jgi:hypothetical protein
MALSGAIKNRGLMVDCLKTLDPCLRRDDMVQEYSGFRDSSLRENDEFHTFYSPVIPAEAGIQRLRC